jgi:hypothetical protein
VQGGLKRELTPLLYDLIDLSPHLSPKHKMAATFSLKIGKIDLADSFHDIIDCFDHTECDKNDEALQLGLLKLRLCRWRNASVQLTWTSNETPEGADTNLFGVLLDSIKTSLESGAERADVSPPVKETCTAGAKQLGDHWLAEMLDGLAAQHQGPSRQPSSADSRPKTAVPRATLMVVKGFIDRLEVVELRRKLAELRNLDANALKMHDQACEKDINLLKASAVAVDPEFGTLLRWGGGSYSNIIVGDDAIGHYGNNIASGETSTRATYQGVEAGGRTISHFGDTIGNYQGRTVFDN